MVRTAEVHRMRSGLVLILLVDSLPRCTLFGADAVELESIGREWVDFRSRSTKPQFPALPAACRKLYKTWDGVERRRRRR